METAELTSAALDWAVAKCLVLTGSARGFEVRNGKPMYLDGYWDDAQFHFNWEQGGPIIEREGINLFLRKGAVARAGKPWLAYNYDQLEAEGPTPLVAAMRCYVASKLGDSIDIPEELK